MFKEDVNGSIYYEGKNGQHYTLLEGIDNKNLTSDIIFIYKEPIIEINGEEYGDVTDSDVIDWFYGGFRTNGGKLPQDVLNYIEDRIKEYENKVLGSESEGK